MKRVILGVVLASLCGSAMADPLSAWNDTAAKKAIMEWVKNTTNADRSTYIPPEKRYVVFDNDGTLWP